MRISMDAPEALHRSSLSPLLAGTPLPEPITPEVNLADNLPDQPTTGEPASAEVEHVISSLKIAEAEARHLLSEIEADGTGKTVVEDVKTFGEFWLKFLNDWIPHFACGLA